ncbi:ADS_G0016240.mRNA.1.CDS.1 [Saccharomyces cerevisiae]|nr:ADS_G0016240.mRNA.1.CDS.1 [Saccharomyces cerevisiae]CAI6635714.1 ADS_G0016240.mRNA.1.CDS.1 [Saccharomyces cerevisiae]
MQKVFASLEVRFKRLFSLFKSLGNTTQIFGISFQMSSLTSSVPSRTRTGGQLRVLAPADSGFTDGLQGYVEFITQTVNEILGKYHDICSS